MPSDTSNHQYNRPDRGQRDWGAPLNSNFDTLDVDVEVRDTDANKGNYTPLDRAKYLATDTGAVYLGDGSSWTQLGTIGSEYSDEDAQDATNALLSAGSNVSLSYDDANDTLTISATDTDTDTRIDVADSSGVVLSEPTEVAFAASGDASVAVSDDGDGTATVDVSAQGGSSYTTTAQSSAYTASTNEVVLADASGGSFDVTLPSASDGRLVTVKKTDSSTNAVGVVTPNSESIDGQSSQSLDSQYEAIEMISDGSNWYII